MQSILVSLNFDRKDTYRSNLGVRHKGRALLTPGGAAVDAPHTGFKGKGLIVLHE